MKHKLWEVVAKSYPKNAKILIKAGKVLVNEEVTLMPHKLINEQDKVRIIPSKSWVSRGALKLIEAINQFSLNFENKIILDIGSSTGGFTEVAIKHGAKKVYALDVGRNQLDYKLRINPRVIALEKTNLKIINKDLFSEKIDLVVCDVSFISLKKVFKVLSDFEDIELMALIKPQFEASNDQVEAKGIVDKKYHSAIINNIIEIAAKYNFEKINVAPSPIKGLKSKNIEYISLFRKG